MIVAGMKLGALVEVWVKVVASRGHRCCCLEKSRKSSTPTFFCDFRAKKAVEKVELPGDVVSSCVHNMEEFYT